MKKKMLPKTAAILAAALTISACGLSVSAESYNHTPVNESAPAAVILQEEDNVYSAALTDHDYDSGYEIALTANSNSENKDTDWLKIILISLGISILVTGITVYFIYKGYKYNGMTEPYEFKDKAPLDLTDSEDVLIDVHVTSVHINRDKS